jgi:hypothetical protein
VSFCPKFQHLPALQALACKDPSSFFLPRFYFFLINAQKSKIFGMLKIKDFHAS